MFRCRHLNQLLEMHDLGFSSEQYMCMETVEAGDGDGTRAPAANDRKGFGDIAARESSLQDGHRA